MKRVKLVHKGNTRYITEAALIAAMYVAVTVILWNVSFMPEQIRVAEALTILPAFTPAAVPGLFIGCLISNTLSPVGVPDIIFGSAATLIAALLTRFIMKKVENGSLILRSALLPIPSVVINVLIIGPMLSIVYDLSLAVTALDVFVGQALSCYALGIPFYMLLLRQKSIKWYGDRQQAG